MKSTENTPPSSSEQPKSSTSEKTKSSTSKGAQSSKKSPRKTTIVLPAAKTSKKSGQPKPTGDTSAPKKRMEVKIVFPKKKGGKKEKCIPVVSSTSSASLSSLMRSSSSDNSSVVPSKIVMSTAFFDAKVHTVQLPPVNSASFVLRFLENFCHSLQCDKFLSSQPFKPRVRIHTPATDLDQNKPVGTCGSRDHLSGGSRSKAQMFDPGGAGGATALVIAPPCGGWVMVLVVAPLGKCDTEVLVVTAAVEYVLLRNVSGY
ncbi:Sex comb on midleg-like protein 2 [Cricetulus griseus]|uniref:Sex comb on midleg-like protein 2 n=1 Tax=Cricetulus griseus TaxID=10029 RepID=G3HKK6_CRIGR|nr:Sex comb on midleg-like protein 2 [Cricetulus griseus]